MEWEVSKDALIQLKVSSLTPTSVAHPASLGHTAVPLMRTPFSLISLLVLTITCKWLNTSLWRRSLSSILFAELNSPSFPQMQPRPIGSFSSTSSYFCPFLFGVGAHGIVCVCSASGLITAHCLCMCCFWGNFQKPSLTCFVPSFHVKSCVQS